jgi:hypothetical protein
MIFLFERIPINKSSASSLKDSFSKLKINIEDMQSVEKITEQKQAFYGFFSHIFSDKNFLPQFQQIEEQMAYLWATLDLLDVGMRASYAIRQKYSPFLDTERTLAFENDQPSTLLAEYIFSRFVFALGTIKFLKKPIQSHLKKVFESSNFNSEESKQNIKLFKLGFVRLAKLYKNKALIWVN